MTRTSSTLILFRDLSVSARQDGARYELIAEFPTEQVSCRWRRDFPLQKIRVRLYWRTRVVPRS